MKETTTYRRIEALKTADEILNYLDHQKNPVSGKEVAEAIGTPHATVMCHLATMEDLGWVRSVGGHWEMGMVLAMHWARFRSNTEGKISALQAQLREVAA